MNTAPIAKSVIYRRANAEMPSYQKHLEEQEDSARKYAREHGYNVEHVFTDTKASPDEWTGMTEMLTFLAGQAETVAVIAEDRSKLSRNLAEVAAIRKEITDAGGILMYSTPDTGTPDEQALVETAKLVQQRLTGEL